jgi:hypothetical protein
MTTGSRAVVIGLMFAPAIGARLNFMNPIKSD